MRRTIRRFRPIGVAAVLGAVWSAAALALEGPAPSDALPGDKIEAGPALAPANEPATGRPTLAPTPADKPDSEDAEASADANPDGVEVLTRGPVHEAFAETVSLRAEPGLVAPQAPPEPIEELPPDQKPEGDNVVWIPGYWAWDDEQADFLWVSGIWRVMPPGRKWISGYWRPADDGHQWVSGYWGDAAVEKAEYLPNPPATLEVGPNVAAPSADHIWVPGTWVYRTRYVWQPGYWIVPQPNWVWVPSYYAWTPCGFVFVGGYWDHVVPRRGVLFAPVWFHGGVWARPGFCYSPVAAINLTVFSNHLFCRPRYGHYYFGDFYAASYVSVGIYPWFSYTRYKGYDPLWAHHRWHHRHDRDFARHVEADYKHRRDHQEARPPRNWSDQQAVAKHSHGDGHKDRMAYSLQEAATQQDTPAKFTSLDRETREKLGGGGKEVQKFRQQRQQIESQHKVAADKRPVTLSLPKAPLASDSAPAEGSPDAPPRKPNFRGQAAVDRARDAKPPLDPSTAKKARAAREARTSDDAPSRDKPGTIKLGTAGGDTAEALQPNRSDKSGIDETKAGTDAATAPQVPQTRGSDRPRGNKRGSPQLQPPSRPQKPDKHGEEPGGTKPSENQAAAEQKPNVETHQQRGGEAQGRQFNRPERSASRKPRMDVQQGSQPAGEAPSQRQFMAGQARSRISAPQGGATEQSQPSRSFSRASPPQQPERKPRKRERDK